MQPVDGTISTWKNDRAVRIPNAFLDALGLKDNDTVEISTLGNMITIKPKPKKKNLAEFFQHYTGHYECTEWDIGEPVGREVF